MAARFLLDTNILSDLIRHPQGKIARRIADLGEASICTSIIAACELRYGALKKGSTALSQRVDAILAAMDVIPYERDADRHYASIRWDLARSGRLIGPNDLLIASHALALDMILVTDNTNEFSRVPGLSVENWL